MSAPFNLQNLSLDEYVKNPSLRTVDAFFLGGVFLLALIYMIKSAAVQSLTEGVGTFFYQRTNPSNPESLEADADEKERLRRWVEDVLLGPAESLDPKNLVFILCIFVGNASLAMFGSTLIFSQGQDLMCTFLVAWGGLSAEMIRIVGFIRLSLELRSLHSRQREMYLTWIYMMAIIAFMLLNNAVESGLLRPSAGLNDIYLCYRQHSLWTSLLSSLFNIVFEFYAIVRLIFLLAPPFLQTQHRWVALKDVRIGMAVSLLLMDILTVVPGAIPVSITADCIPFAVGAIIVLIIFNREQALASTTLSRVDSIPSTRMVEIERRDYDASSPNVRTSHTSWSRSIIQRRNSSVSRLGRHPRKSQLPPFSLGAVTVDSGGSQKKELQDLIINITRASQATLTLTPVSSSGGSFRLSGSYETTAQGQVMVAQRAVRPWPSAPPTQMPATHDPPQGHQRQQRTTRATSIHFNKIPPPPAVPPPVPPKGWASKSPSDEDMEPRVSSEHNIRTVTSSVINGSDVIRGKRMYDPTRNVVDVDDHRRRSIASTYISPASSRERWSNVSGWPRTDAEHKAISTHHTGSSSRRDYSIHPNRPTTRRRKDTFGAKSWRSGATYMSDHIDENRRSSFDFAAPMPSFARDDEPESPSTAPVSRMSIVPVVPSATLSPPLVNPHVRRGAMATGVAPSVGDPTSSTRVRFGARPMRSALLADGFREPEEDGMPRELLSSRRGFDKRE